MNYANIKYNDIADGEGIRTSLFVSGCTHHCKGCFNEEAWDFNYGKPFTREVEDRILESLKPSYIAGLTLLGGEPGKPESACAFPETGQRAAPGQKYLVLFRIYPGGASGREPGTL